MSKQQATQDASFPPVTLLNAVHPNLAKLYEPQQCLADHLHLTVEEVYQGLVYFEVPCFSEQVIRDRFCDTPEEIEQDLLRIERDYGATLQQLAQRSRVILLIPGFSDQPHIELVVAFALLVAAMSGSWPDVLSVEFREDASESLQIIYELRLHELLLRYSTAGQRSIIYPSQHEK